MSILISKMTPPYEDKKGDPFYDEDTKKLGCVPFSGVWGELSYCSECYWKLCCLKKEVQWTIKGGKWNEKRNYVQGLAQMD